MARRDLWTTANYLIAAMEGHGVMSNNEIYREAKSLFRRFGRAVPPNFNSAVRQTLQAHCTTTPQWNGRDDFFVHHEDGYWSCKVAPPKVEDLFVE